MADDREFFGEHDPERAIARLAEHAAEVERDRRSAPFLVWGGATVTTGLVIAAFVLGVTHESEPAGATARPAPTVTVTTPAVDVRVAPRAILAPKPKPKPKPAPAEPETEVQSPSNPVIVQTSVQPPKETTPSKQVGPNRPITKPIDPDDR
ncbi:MAG TPA: hypothetical protein VLI04_17085 [Nocardioidaceae bacterium]|nr:hypothetical protein [Nocardioidaceae bacterium]